MRRARRATIVAACVLAASTGGAAVAPASAGAALPHGHLVLIGGNLREDAVILQRIVDLADPDGTGPQRARIAIVTAAATPARNPGEAGNPKKNNAAANGLYYAALFERFGATTYAVPIDESVDFAKDAYVPANADDPKVASRIRRATGVFFGGGDQMRYVRTLLDCDPAPDEAFTSCRDTVAMAAVRDVLDAGGVVAGVSAGTTIQQGADMVTGGESYQGWRDGATPGYLDDATQLAYLPYGGFGFFDEALVDSHFTTWGRQARMIRLAAETGHELAVGVDETTALVYDRVTRVGEVIGEHGVSVLDLAGADVAGEDATGVRWSYLVSGDRIDFANLEVTSGSPASAGSGVGAGPSEANDVWDSIDGTGSVYTLRDLARALVASAAATASGTTFETGPQYRTTLHRDAATTWWDGGFDGLVVDIDPVGP